MWTILLEIVKILIRRTFCFSSVFVGLTSGVIQSYDLSATNKEWNDHMKLNGGVIERMKRSSLKSHIVATGGRDNDLKLWDMNTKSAIFAAKNVSAEKSRFICEVCF